MATFSDIPALNPDTLFSPMAVDGLLARNRLLGAQEESATASAERTRAQIMADSQARLGDVARAYIATAPEHRAGFWAGIRSYQQGRGLFPDMPEAPPPDAVMEGYARIGQSPAERRRQLTPGALVEGGAAPAPPAVASGPTTVPASLAGYAPIFQAAAQEHSVPLDLAYRVAGTESGGRQGAVSPRGALGVMQLMPGTASDLGVNPNDPEQNIRGGVRYLGDMLRRYGGDQTRALAAYNWGPGNVDRWVAGGADPAGLPAETRAYLQRIQGAGTSDPVRAGTRAAAAMTDAALDLPPDQQAAALETASRARMAAAGQTERPGGFGNVRPTAPVPGWDAGLARPLGTIGVPGRRADAGGAAARYPGAVDVAGLRLPEPAGGELVATQGANGDTVLSAEPVPTAGISDLTPMAPGGAMQFGPGTARGVRLTPAQGRAQQARLGPVPATNADLELRPDETLETVRARVQAAQRITPQALAEAAGAADLTSDPHPDRDPANRRWTPPVAGQPATATDDLPLPPPAAPTPTPLAGVPLAAPPVAPRRASAPAIPPNPLLGDIGADELNGLVLGALRGEPQTTEPGRRIAGVMGLNPLLAAAPPQPTTTGSALLPPVTSETLAPLPRSPLLADPPPDTTMGRAFAQAQDRRAAAEAGGAPAATASAPAGRGGLRYLEDAEGNYAAVPGVPGHVWASGADGRRQAVPVPGYDPGRGRQPQFVQTDEGVHRVEPGGTLTRVGGLPRQAGTPGSDPAAADFGRSETGRALAYVTNWAAAYNEGTLAPEQRRTYEAAAERYIRPTTRLDPASGQVVTITPNLPAFAPRPGTFGQRSVGADAIPAPTMPLPTAPLDEGSPAPSTAQQPAPSTPPPAAAAPTPGTGAAGQGATATRAVPGATVTTTGERPDRALTEGQARSNTFGLEMTAAEQTLSTLTTPSGAAIAAFRNLPNGVVNPALGENDQRFFNAMQRFAAGVLRKETGAGLSAGEVDNVMQRFFPSAGDSAAVIRDKAAARARAIEAMRAEMPGGQFRGAAANGGGEPQPVRVNSPEEARRQPRGTALVFPDGTRGWAQ